MKPRGGHSDKPAGARVQDGKRPRNLASGRRGSPLLAGLLCVISAAGAYWWVSRSLGPSDESKSRRPVASIDPIPGVTASTSRMTMNLDAMPPLPPIDTNDPVRVLNRGTQLLEMGLFDEAIAHYRRATELKKDDEEAFFNLGFAHGRLGKEAAASGRSAEAAKYIAEAKRWYAEALRVFPDYAEAHKNLGNLLVSEGRYEEAIRHLSAAIRINPDNSSALNSLGQCLALQGRTQEALAQFREALRLNTNSIEARFNVASACVRLGRLDEAISELEKVLAQAPEMDLAAQQLAEVRAMKAAGKK